MTSTEETQALFPVTQANRDLARDWMREQGDLGRRPFDIADGKRDDHTIVQLIARASQSHSLPGDVGTALAGLEWSEDSYSLRTPYDGDVDGDGRHVVVGGETVIAFADSEVGDEYRARILAALTPSGLSGDAGEGDKHYTVVMERRPKEIGGVKVGPGLYRIHWKSGGSSLAAIGMCQNGAWWVAPTNWVEPAVAFPIDEDPEGRWSWQSIEALERIDADQGAGEP